MSDGIDDAGIVLLISGAVATALGILAMVLDPTTVQLGSTNQYSVQLQ